MHEHFSAFVRHGKGLADVRNLDWDFPTDDAGASHTGWNLTELVGGHQPNHYLRDLGSDTKTLAELNAKRIQDGLPALPKKRLSPAWCDLIKAAACEQLFFRRNTTTHVVNNIVRPLKALATSSCHLEPWQLNADVVREAVERARQLQPSGKLADQVIGVVKNVIDTNHLAEACPLYPALGIKRQHGENHRKPRAAKSKKQLLDELDQRKNAEKLPERKAFWELNRILSTEQPRTYTDAVRFAALRVMLGSGLRIGEVVLLPADWKRTRDYYDPTGRPAGELGGYSRSLMLRYFAEKQQSENSDSTVMFESAQCIPRDFEEYFTKALDDAVRLTQPLRDTLRLQVETGRLLPWYAKDDLVPATELYTRITGNPFWLDLPEDIAEEFMNRYRQNFDPQVLNELSQYQLQQYKSSVGTRKLNMAMYVFFNRLVNNTSQHAHLLKLRDSSGREYMASRKTWSEVYLHVGELEDYLVAEMPTKISDLKSVRLGTSYDTSSGTSPIPTSLGTNKTSHNTNKTSPDTSHGTKEGSHSMNDLKPWEFLFLTPKRSVAEERNGGITDITRCFAVGTPAPTLLSLVLGEEKDKRESLFMRYGKTDEDRKLTLTAHSLRHLLNTELFRLGVADTIITKQFGRRSVAQSHEYDNRSLAEELGSIEIPPELEIELGEEASTFTRLVVAGKANGPLTDKIKRIQLEEGDEAAFRFLKAEADGFHATPYGHCINSFTVDPCPRNLECFAGCRHLTATNLPENRRHLEKLEHQFGVALAEVQARPAGTVGRENQIAHATIRLENVRKLLTTPNGARVFPNGPDFSKQVGPRSVLDDE